MHNLGEREPEKWLADLAWRIHKLIDEFGAMGRVREMVILWHLRYAIGFARLKGWERRRREHEDTAGPVVARG